MLIMQTNKTAVHQFTSLIGLSLSPKTTEKMNAKLWWYSLVGSAVLSSVLRPQVFYPASRGLKLSSSRR